MLFDEQVPLSIRRISLNRSTGNPGRVTVMMLNNQVSLSIWGTGNLEQPANYTFTGSYSAQLTSTFIHSEEAVSVRSTGNLGQPANYTLTGPYAAK
jgi:hypothetical protein